MERQTLSLDAGRFEVLATGAAGAPVVLFLHGFPDVPGSWAGVMERVAAAGHRCVAPWTRGYAPSTVRGPFDVERLADDALAIADALSPDEPMVLVGHDWGAASTYVACVRGPSRIRAAVTISVPHPLAFLGALRRSPAQLARSGYMGFFQIPRLPERAIREQGLVERLWRAWSPGLDVPSAHLDEVVATVRASLPGPLGPYRAMTWPPSAALRRVADARHDRITVPTLYLHGLDDGCIGFECARGQERFFDAPLRTELIAGAGHFLPLERPDEVASRILRWLRLVG